jgi:hypothetical protein
MEDILVGVALGLLTSLVGWWIVGRAITPKLALAPKISKLPDETGKATWRYRVKLVNLRRWWLPDWPVVDLHVTGTLRVRGLSTSSIWAYYSVPLGRGGDIELFPTSRMFRARVYDMDTESGDFQRFPKPIQDAIIRGDIELEDLLSVGEEAELQVVASGSHSYTQARRTVIKTYRRDDVVAGRFVSGHRRTGLRFVAANSPPPYLTEGVLPEQSGLDADPASAAARSPLLDLPPIAEESPPGS